MDSTRGGSERLFPNDNRAESTTTNACIFNAERELFVQIRVQVFY